MRFPHKATPCSGPRSPWSEYAQVDRLPATRNTCATRAPETLTYQGFPAIHALCQQSAAIHRMFASRQKRLTGLGLRRLGDAPRPNGRRAKLPCRRFTAVVYVSNRTASIISAAIRQICCLDEPLQTAGDWASGSELAHSRRASLDMRCVIRADTEGRTA
jgi:hypothetical protein